MEGRSAVWLLAALLLEALISAEAQNTPEYLEVGSKLVLRPEPVSDSIQSISWKLNGNIVGEWNKETLPLVYSPAFSGRASVDTTTGVLEISNTMKNHSGLYTVEINDRAQEGGYDVGVINQVPEPKAFMTPLTCSQSSESCFLSCDGDTTDAGPVTFSFRKGDGGWEEGEKNIKIMNDEDTQAVPTFSCRMKNPLGEKDSEPVDNLFYVGSNTGKIVGGVVGGLLIAFCVAAGVVFYLKKGKSGNTADRTAAGSTQENGAKPEERPLNDVNPKNDSKEDV